MKKCVNISIILFIFEEIHEERKNRNPQREDADFSIHVSLSKNQEQN